MKNPGFAIILISIMLLIASPSGASTYLDVNDEVYVLLSRLEAEGVITDALLTTKPLSRRELVRLVLAAEANTVGRGEFMQELVRELRQRVRVDEYQAGTIKPLDSVSVKYIYTTAPVLTLSYPGAAREQEQAFNYNNDGDLYGNGSNLRTGFISRLENLGRVSLYLEPELRSAEGAEQGVLKKGYGVLGFSWIDVVAGRDSQWWGPGYHGALLLSNNAEPLTMLKFTGPGPQVLPWIFRYLGPFQYDLFVTRLEKDRSDFSEPYLWGMRFNFKPHPGLELGVERTGLLGGRGRSTNVNTWLSSMFGTNEHSSQNPGDQRAGYDLKLTLPFEVQPVQLYWQQAGEENWPRDFQHTYRYASLCGIYLPRILGLAPLDLRAEYARNHVRNTPYAWYVHGIYTAGYTYRGMIMGHHMGTASRDLFLELSWLLPEKSARISLSLDREKHDQVAAVTEKITEIGINARFPISKRLEVMATCAYAEIEDSVSIAGPKRSAREFSSMVRYEF